MYKLNNTEIDIRRRIGEETKDDKVHGASPIMVHTDIIKKEDDNKYTNQQEKKDKKKYMTIDGIKPKSYVVEASKPGESIEEGSIIDKKT